MVSCIEQTLSEPDFDPHETDYTFNMFIFQLQNKIFVISILGKCDMTCDIVDTALVHRAPTMILQNSQKLLRELARIH